MTKTQAFAKLDDVMDDSDLSPRERAAIKRAAGKQVGKIDWAALIALIKTLIDLFRK